MLLQHKTVRQIPLTQPAPDHAPRLHVAIISDGNGRWAVARGLPRSAGHRAGAETARRVIEAAPRMGIHTLTLFALSSANWKRPPAEVQGILRLLHELLHRLGAAVGVVDGERQRRVVAHRRVGVEVLGRQQLDRVDARVEAARREIAVRSMKRAPAFAVSSGQTSLKRSI